MMLIVRVESSEYSSEAPTAMVDQGRGLGVGLLQDAIRRSLMVADQAGVRALLTHPISEAAARFYLRFGFEASPAREQQLILLLKDARRLLVNLETLDDVAFESRGDPVCNPARLCHKLDQVTDSLRG
jgi:hypothetical protein